MFDYERELTGKGYKFIAGVDEAGRGPLAGPVVVAAVIMPLNDVIDGVNDSKKLTAKKRDDLYEKILTKAVEYKVAVISHKTIDEINILNATKQGMLQCINGLSKKDYVLIDAVKTDCDVPSLSIIHGDALSYNIAAASIIAKVTRDRLMCELDKQYPNITFLNTKDTVPRSTYVC